MLCVILDIYNIKFCNGNMLNKKFSNFNKIFICILAEKIFSLFKIWLLIGNYELMVIVDYY